ncbi:TetR/AcrR family transcriptional regulator [Kutzneria buriramensis]|uniref:AcrR family transcriptional regulator n=1 Tax=Kutzneria buriramensis TaxID=1045776 RepID=A0A3E0HYL6_9PSEU|nr:TetR/AcrR family transcriptional regulator [Kutzneria buriramensis]REH51562.1 AcrR family transcriptional regulator [Kutzneria buriramensis]
MSIERADAARNRAKVLAAAARLFAEAGTDTVTMDEIAKAAGIGRATLYRRYPDTRSIALALLDEHERELQAKIISGAPPLGPGATPGERLAAFLAALADLLERHLHLALGAETGHARYTTGAYALWRSHVRLLLAEAGAEDPDTLCDMVLAPLAPEVYWFQRHTRGHSAEQITAALRLMASRLSD